MQEQTFKKIPTHIGIIPDGNRRWALNQVLGKHEGYNYGIFPGFELYELLLEYGVKEATFYGFTNDNTKRPAIQKKAFIKACIDAVKLLSNRDANLLVVGNTTSDAFPKELLPYTKNRVKFGKGLININFLVNYDWKWDIKTALNISKSTSDLYKSIASNQIPRMDMIIRWGGHNRLSGFLPIQSVYSDIYIIKEYWPDFKKEHFLNALKWYSQTDDTYGG